MTRLVVLGVVCKGSKVVNRPPVDVFNTICAGASKTRDQWIMEFYEIRESYLIPTAMDAVRLLLL